MGLWVIGWGENAGDIQAALESLREILGQVAGYFLKWAWNGQILTRNSVSVLGEPKEKGYSSSQVTLYEILPCNLLQALNKGIWHEEKCNIVAVVLLLICPLFMVLSILACTENSVLAILDFCGIDSEVLLVWIQKTFCVLEHDVALRVWWWILNRSISELPHEKENVCSQHPSWKEPSICNYFVTGSWGGVTV